MENHAAFKSSKSEGQRHVGATNALLQFTAIKNSLRTTNNCHELLPLAKWTREAAHISRHDGGLPLDLGILEKLLIGSRTNRPAKKIFGHTRRGILPASRKFLRDPLYLCITEIV